MITFSDLPADVVHTIIHVADNATAEALSRTSKSLHQLAEPILYRDITVFIDPSALLDPKYAFAGFFRIWLLLRTLQSKPQLALVTRRLTLELTGDDDASFLARQLAIKRPLDSDSISYQKVLIALFLQLRRLEHLQIPLGCASHFKFLFAAHQHALQNLKSLCYSPPPQLDTWNRNYKDEDLSLLSFLCAPKLSSLDVVLPGVQLVRDTPSAALLKNLTLRHTQFSPASLAILLRATNCLGSLQYDYDCDLDELCRSDYVDDWGRLREGLRCVAGTLKHLSLALDFHCLEDHKEYWHKRASSHCWLARGKLGDISFLEALETLEIPLPMLLGWDPEKDVSSLDEVLPANLVEVSFRDDLVDWIGEYPWTYLEPQIVGRESKTGFYDPVVVEPVLHRLKSLAVSSNTKLMSVKLLMSHGYLWPGHHLHALRSLFTAKGANRHLLPKIWLRMDHEDSEETRDLVREIIIDTNLIGNADLNDSNTASVVPQWETAFQEFRYHTFKLTNKWENQLAMHEGDVDNGESEEMEGDFPLLGSREMRIPLRTFTQHS
ncbi:hypothetical protein BLS_007360 [Venturia inaequalis]|uniref:F-box domain-containing protein n=1 Tax=Venturia inaequalis TaxID=5025 RepID=A0A8H3U9Z6_VENIN|nr:hypothetical protein BLS_007360 [Venturia inaequalis]KAE9987504.1 hypothetical protein EG328_002489 [Venturia inaequalis]